MSNKTVLEIRDIGEHKILHINDSPINSHEVLGVLGEGANGIVYLTNNRILDRKEAVKVWLKNREKDKRDKLEQGLAEARKLAAANKESAVEIYSTQIVDGVPIAMMEYVDGETLKEFKKRVNHKGSIIEVIRLYLEAIENTTTSEIFHGDPHLSNVLVYKYSPDIFTDETRLKLCDFGTSIFSGKEKSIDRHWRLVENSVVELTKGLDKFEFAQKELPKFKASYKKNVDIDKWKEFATDKQVAQVINSPLRQYIDCFNEY